MGLGAEGYFRAEKEHLAFAYCCFNNGRASVQVLLPPGPATAEWFGIGEPGDGVHALQIGVGQQSEYGIVAKHQIQIFRYAVSYGGGIIYLHPQNGSRQVEFLAGKSFESSIRIDICQGVGKR